MNSLKERFGDNLAVLSFPCNQFGHQENTSGEVEILNSLKHVRPGNGFIPHIDMIFEKVEVNGAGVHPLFKFLKEKLPFPSDDYVSLMGDPRFFIWSPVLRTDISWNFEKFLIDKNGIPTKRFSRKFETIDIAQDIEDLLRK